MSTTNPNANVSPVNQAALTPASPAPAPAATVPITATANGGNRGTKVSLQASYQALVVGLQTYYQPNDVFRMKSGTFTRDELIAEFQKFIALAEATKNTHTAWRGAVQTERASELEVRPLRQGVHAMVSVRFGKAGTEVLQFGFAQAKPGTKKPATKVQAADKAKATRTARATKGKKQRLAIKAQPATAAPAAAPQATPVAAAPAAPAGAPAAAGAAPAGH
jgi:hypothetical protein